MADDSLYGNDYNAMQASAGLLPVFSASAPAVMYPGQISAQLAQNSLSGMMGFQQPLNTFTGGPRLMPGPGGILMPMGPGGPNQAYGGMGMGGMGPMTPPSIFTGYGQMPPPPMYRGPMGAPPNIFAPSAPPAYFNTPFQANYQQQEATDFRAFGMNMAGVGVAGRGMTDLAAGGVGAALGARFGGARGAMVGGALGFLGSEFSGLGQHGQNFFMNNLAAPAINMRGFGAGIENLSQGFVAGGAFGSITGAGFSRGASVRGARMLEDMSNSSDFRQETFNRFNTSDVMKITQGAAQNGLMQGVQSPDQMKERVRNVAKSLQSFMELANEPDIQRAISTMGNMRSQGMNLQETMQAVQNGRSFARMAGTTFETLANIGGGQGAATFGSMGLSQGLGARTGMMNYGLAGSSQNLGTLNPALMNMLGGAQGLSNMNNMFSANVLQMPMMAPGMMNVHGGLNPNSIQALMSGRTDAMSMTGVGANNLTAMTQRMGVGGLGMAVGMQPVLQDALGRMIQQQGPFAQRTMEDRQIFSLSRRMGLHGSEGFMSAAQMMGMSGTQAYARAQEMNDPRFFDRMRDQIETRRSEGNAEERRRIEAAQPGFLDTLSSESSTVFGARRGIRNLGRGIRDIYESAAGGGPDSFYSAESAGEARRMRTLVGSREYGRHLDETGGGSTTERSFYDRMSMSRQIAEARGGRGIASILGAGIIGASTSDRELESMIRERADMGRFTSNMLNSGARQQNSALRSMDRTFGGSDEALRGFSTDVANMYNNPTSAFGGATGAGIANTAFRGGVNFLSRGLVDPGNIVGTRSPGMNDLRESYIRNMSRNGGSREDLARRFDANSSTIALQAAPGAVNMMTDVAFNRFQQENLAANRTTSRTGDYEGAERQAYSGILGDNAGNTRSRRAFDTIAGAFGEGFGNTQAQRDRSRTLMTSLAILQRQVNDPAQQHHAQEQANQLIAEAQRRGMSREDIAEAQRRSAAARGRLSGAELTDAAAGMNMSGTGADIFNRVASADRNRMTTTADRRVATGFASLARDRTLGVVFRGTADGGHVNMDALRNNLTGMSEDQIAELADRDPNMGRLIQQFQSGNERQREAALAQIRQTGYSQGLRTDRIQHRAHEMGRRGRFTEGWRRGNGFWGGLWEGISGAVQSDEEYANERLPGGSAADEQATREGRDVDALEGQARGQGMGQASDRLLRAAESLENASRNLMGTAQSGQLDDMIGGHT